MTKEIVIEEITIDGQWYPEAKLFVRYKIEPAEKGLKDKYGQLNTPNFGSTIVISKAEFESANVLKQLTPVDIAFLYREIEKELEYAD